VIEIYLQVFVYGIFTGSLYGLGAVGLALIFGVMDMIQVAHGSMIMLGGYFCFWLFEIYFIDPFLSLPLAAVVFFFAGIFLFKALFSPLIKLSEDDRTKNSMLVAFGAILVIDNLATILWTGNMRTVAPPYQGLAFRFFNLQIPFVSLVNLILAAMLIFGLNVFLKKTYLGKSIRAAAQNFEVASLMGVNIGRTYSIAMGIATALGAAAGVLVILNSGVDPGIGMDWMLKALLITVLAGTGNIGGIFISGLFFGILEAIGSIFIGPYKELIGLVLFLAVLIWRPEGLFSGKRA
jgi:branched-chain amino acid transport system permease protein